MIKISDAQIQGVHLLQFNAEGKVVLDIDGERSMCAPLGRHVRRQADACDQFRRR